MGRPELPPYHGAKATCAHCGRMFHLSLCQRSDIRRKVDRPRYCGGGCQRGARGAANGKASAAKIRATLIARYAAPTSYPKFHGRHEHRHVAEKILARTLRKGEVVHHIDGDRRNNAPGNLQVLTSQSEHARLHSRKPKP